MSDPVDEGRKLAQGLLAHASDLALAVAALGAALIRLALYTGPARPLKALLADCAVMWLVALGVGELAYGVTGNEHQARGLALLAALFGWEGIKHIAAKKFGGGR